MKIKRIAVTIFLILFVGVNCILSIKFTQNTLAGFVNLGLPAKLVEHYNAPGNFTISIPPTWYPMDMQHGNHGDESVVLIVENTLETLYITAFKYKNIKSQNDVVNLATKKIIDQSQNSYQSVQMENYQGNKYLGLIHEYLITKTHPFFGKREFHCIDWYTYTQNKAGYGFSFCVQEEYWLKAKPTFLEIINSIVFN